MFEIFEGAAATSGIGKRSWLDGEGRSAHHLLNPATGKPAFSGVVLVVFDDGHHELVAETRLTQELRQDESNVQTAVQALMP